jgi:hypothetical protein
MDNDCLAAAFEIFFFVFWVAFLKQALNKRQATVKNGQ